MARRQSSTRAQFACQHGGCDNAGQLASIISRVGGMCTSNTQQIEHGGLRFKDGSAADCSNFNARH
jgi:hypothetical protein